MSSINYVYWEEGRPVITDRKNVADEMRNIIRREMYDRVLSGECTCEDFRFCKDDCQHCKNYRKGITESVEALVKYEEDDGFSAEIIDKHASVEDQVIWKITVEEACKYLDKKRSGLSKVFLMRLSGYNLKEIGECLGKSMNDIYTDLRRIRRYLEPIRESMFGV